MKLLFTLNQLAQIQKKTALTIGNFDGVHLGHQALFSRLIMAAQKRDLASVVLLFEPQPPEYFSPVTSPARLSSLREKLAIIGSFGIDYVCCVRFNHFFANIDAETFIQQIILTQLHAQHLLLGHDFRFGKQRQGDIALLKSQLAGTACELEIYADFLFEGERISSTGIRHFLALGQLDKAQSLLSRSYSMTGRVVTGDGRARQWGFPTANIKISRKNSPLNGVFCVRVKRGNHQIIEGVANIGFRPTVDGRRLVLEIHLFDFSDSLYGERLDVFFLHKLRDEQCFESIEALVGQIEQDVQAARNYFS